MDSFWCTDTLRLKILRQCCRLTLAQTLRHILMTVGSPNHTHGDRLSEPGYKETRSIANPLCPPNLNDQRPTLSAEVAPLPLQ